MYALWYRNNSVKHERADTLQFASQCGVRSTAWMPNHSLFRCCCWIIYLLTFIFRFFLRQTFEEYWKYTTIINRRPKADSDEIFLVCLFAKLNWVISILGVACILFCELIPGWQDENWTLTCFNAASRRWPKMLWRFAMFLVAVLITSNSSEKSARFWGSYAPVTPRPLGVCLYVWCFSHMHV